MTSAEEDEELDETVEQDVHDTTWSWVKWILNLLNVWNQNWKMWNIGANIWHEKN